MPYMPIHARRLLKISAKKSSRLEKSLAEITRHLATLDRISKELDRMQNPKQIKNMQAEIRNLDKLRAESCGYIRDIVARVETEMIKEMVVPVKRLEELRDLLNNIGKQVHKKAQQTRTTKATGQERNEVYNMGPQVTGLQNTIKKLEHRLNVLRETAKAKTIEDADDKFAHYSELLGFEKNHKISAELMKLPIKERRGLFSIRQMCINWGEKYTKDIAHYKRQLAAVQKHTTETINKEAGHLKGEVSEKGKALQAISERIRKDVVPLLNSVTEDIPHRMRLLASQFKQIRTANNIHDLTMENPVASAKRITDEIKLELRIESNVRDLNSQMQELRKSLVHYTPDEIGLTSQVENAFSQYTIDIQKMTEYLRTGSRHSINLLTLCSRILRLMLEKFERRRMTLLQLQKKHVIIPMSELNRGVEEIKITANDAAIRCLATGNNIAAQKERIVKAS